MKTILEKNLLEYYNVNSKCFNSYKTLDYLNSIDRVFYAIVEEIRTSNNNYAIHVENRFYNYVYFENNERLQYGWKIHLSTNINNAQDILRKAALILINNHIDFKYIKDSFVLLSTTMKVFDRQQFGKFITIYPNSKDKFKDIIELLYFEFQKYDGVHILSDENYKDSRIVFYRYGAHYPKHFYNEQNNLTYLIQNENGSYIEDKRLPFFFVPEGVEYIFIKNNKVQKVYRIFEEYEFIKALKFTNMGGIYLGESKDGTEVIIKEARPHTSKKSMSDVQDSRVFKKNEFEKLTTLTSLKKKLSPRPFGEYNADDYYYVVQEKIDGVLYQEKLKENPLYRGGYTNSEMISYLKYNFQIILSLIHNVKEYFELGLVNSDLCPDNIIIDSKGNPIIIDWESCVNADDLNEGKDISFRYGSMGYRNDHFNEKIPERSDDIFSIYALVISIFYFNPVMFELNRDSFLIHLKEIGNCYPSLRKVIAVLLKFPIFKPFNQRNSLMNIEVLEHHVNDLIKLVSALHNRFKTIYSEKNIIYSQLPKFTHIAKTVLKCLKENEHEYKYTPYFENSTLGYGSLGLYYYLDLLGNDNEDTIRILESEIYEEYMNKGIYMSNSLNRGKLGYLLVFQKFSFLDVSEHLDEFLTTIDSLIPSISHTNIEFGIAGVGIFCLRSYDITKDRRYLDSAELILREIISRVENGNFLLNNEIGLMHGSTGILLFLIQMMRYNTEKTSHIGTIERLINFELKNFVVTSMDKGFPSDADSMIIYPYMSFGTAGVLRVILYLFEDEILIKRLPNDLIKSLKDIVNDLIETISIGVTVSSGYSMGLTGIISTLYHVEKLEKNGLLELLDSKKLKYDIKRLESLLNSKLIYEGNEFSILGDQSICNTLDLNSGLLGIALLLKQREHETDYYYLFQT